MNKADLRTLVLEMIHECDTLEGFKSQISRRAASDFNPIQDMLKAHEVLWELLVQGILAPGRDEADTWFPYFHLTEYGRQCLEAGSILPHDPDGYLKQLQSKIGQQLDDIVRIYITEGLQTFLGGHYLAATVMLGVASERCIDLLIEAYLNAITDVNKKIDSKETQDGQGAVLSAVSMFLEQTF